MTRHVILVSLVGAAIVCGCQKSRSPGPKSQNPDLESTNSGMESKSPSSKPEGTTRPNARVDEYDIAYVPSPRIVIDGKLDEKAWDKADLITNFHMQLSPPSSRASGPASASTPAATPQTQFRALCDDANLYFAFRVCDDDIMVTPGEKFATKTAGVQHDRVEFFFCRDEQSDVHYGLEIDPRGRTNDFKWTFSQYHLDNSWSCEGLKVAGGTFNEGYIIEGSIPLKTLDSLGMHSLRSGGTMLVGVFRGDYYHVGDEVQSRWMSWISPRSPPPSFHRREFFGRFYCTFGISILPPSTVTNSDRPIRFSLWRK